MIFKLVATLMAESKKWSCSLGQTKEGIRFNKVNKGLNTKVLIKMFTK